MYEEMLVFEDYCFSFSDMLRTKFPKCVLDCFLISFCANTFEIMFLEVSGSASSCYDEYAR